MISRSSSPDYSTPSSKPGAPGGAPRVLIGIAEVCRRTGRSRMSIWRYLRDPQLAFPQPVTLGKRDRGWFEDEVAAWIERRPRVE